MRFHVVRVDEEALNLVKEALKLTDLVSSMLSRFEENILNGSLEEELLRLSNLLEQLFVHGITVVDTALERSRLLAAYAHALRVRLSNIPRAEQRYLTREYNDFMRHVGYIKSVLSQLSSILDTVSHSAGSVGEGYGRSRAHPAE